LKKKKRTGFSTPSSDISAPFGAEISLFGAIILLNSDVSVPNDAEISLEGVKISLAKKKKKKKKKRKTQMGCIFHTLLSKHTSVLVA
jgi:hypothetical protein